MKGTVAMNDTSAMNDTGVPVAETPAGPVDGPRRRRIKRALGFTVLALGLSAGAGYLWLDHTSEVHNLGDPQCTDVTPTGTTPAGALEAVCGVLEELTDAWGRGDADAYGQTFAEDATYTTYVGTYYSGRRDITEAHRALFGGFLKGTKLADSFLAVRFYGPTTAIVTSRGDTHDGKPKRPDELSKTQTYTLVRQGDSPWRIAAFHNTQRQSVMERISFLFAPDTRPAAEK